jgi:putative SOS response-associated peptidase YedK
MCNLYSLTKGPQAIPRLHSGDVERRWQHAAASGHLPGLSAPIVRGGAEGRELVLARWGMPSPKAVIEGRKSDPGVTNIRNVASPH